MKNRSDPSRVLSATLPVNPSVTTTSAGACMRSRPFDVADEAETGGCSASSAWVSFTRGVPLDFSSPMDSSATVGSATP